MTDLNRKAFAGLLRLIVTLVLLLFLPGMSFDYREAWSFLFVFSASVVLITVFLMKKDPALLARRVNAGPGAEKEKAQKVIQIIASIAFIAVIVFPAVDHRFRWSAVPPYVAVIGDVLVVLGLLVIFFVFRENSFTSAIIEVEAQQRVVSTGPYALVRHPMYAGALIMLAGVPIALGSWWGLFTIIPITSVLVWRLLDEERLLIEKLPGYAEYRKSVRYRLVPLVW